MSSEWTTEDVRDAFVWESHDYPETNRTAEARAVGRVDWRGCNRIGVHALTLVINRARKMSA